MKREIFTGLLMVGLGQAAVLEFHSFSGLSSAVDASLDGATVADQYGSNQYTSYVGNLALLFADQSLVEDVLTTPRGTIRGDVGSEYGGSLGLVGFCIDSETDFGISFNSDQKFSYEATSWEVAEARYLTEGVGGYRDGGLKRAAYLLENFYSESFDGGDLEAAAMQAAIWEVLTDGSPNLNEGRGNYFLRSSTGNAVLNQRSTEIAALTGQWFAQAEAADWGGVDYDPGDRVIFWLDPNDTQLNQSVITLNPDFNAFAAVPEPGVVLLALMAMTISGFRRRIVREGSLKMRGKTGGIPVCSKN